MLGTGYWQVVQAVRGRASMGELFVSDKLPRHAQCKNMLNRCKASKTVLKQCEIFKYCGLEILKS